MKRTTVMSSTEHPHAVLAPTNTKVAISCLLQPECCMMHIMHCVCHNLQDMCRLRQWHTSKKGPEK